MRRTVMLFGTFDLLHAGHISLFKQARHYGNWLIVVAARDARVIQIKGRRPIYNERERLLMLKHVDLVSEAVLGDKRNVYQIINQRRPKVIALGYDQKIFVDKLRAKLNEFKIKAKVVRLRAYRPRTMKSGRIRRYLSRIV